MKLQNINPGDLSGFTLYCFNEDEPEIDEIGFANLNFSHPDGFTEDEDEDEDEEDDRCDMCGFLYEECECGEEDEDDEE